MEGAGGGLKKKIVQSFGPSLPRRARRKDKPRGAECTHTLWLSYPSADISDCPEWLAWPGVTNVFRIRHEMAFKHSRRTGARPTETARIVASRPRELTVPERLARGHCCAVSNGVHYAPETTWREDACGLRKGTRCRACWQP